MKKTRSHRCLLYALHPGNGGVVVAERTRALAIDRIHAAVENSSTWAHFRKAMHPREYSRLIRQLYDECCEPRPRGSDDFSADCIPAYCDGDYPDWLQQEMTGVIPRALLEDYAQLTNTAFNGAYLHIDPVRLPELKLALEANGYELKDGENLCFY